MGVRLCLLSVPLPAMALADESSRRSMRPLPKWVKELHERDFLKYKFALPCARLRSHSTAPPPKPATYLLSRYLAIPLT